MQATEAELMKLILGRTATASVRLLLERYNITPKKVPDARKD